MSNNKQLRQSKMSKLTVQTHHKQLRQSKMVFSALTLLLSIFLTISSSTSQSISEDFVRCLSQKSIPSTHATKILHFPKNSSYTSILQSSIQNLRFISSTTSKPQCILTPQHESHIQSAVLCSKQHGFQIRVRSGGHDYEGLSYSCAQPFILIDLINLRNITINMNEKTAWVQAGATLGEVYYHISQASKTHAFPGGTSRTVGVGGHISGGGMGTMLRKYGLAADNIVDAYVVDVKGKLLNRKSMGEDLFWAIRGGGGASFGVIVSWKIKLVNVPSTVTVFNVFKKLDHGATTLVSKWQSIADKLSHDLLIRLVIQTTHAYGGKTFEVIFQALFLGNANQLLPVMKHSFPELGLEAKDCKEMSWINSVLLFDSISSGQPTSVLLNRDQSSKYYFKGKSDFVKDSISSTALEGIWKVMGQEENQMMIWEPFGGKMSEISESATPFPHRAGNLYNIQYHIQWKEGGVSEAQRKIESQRRVHNYMGAYVSKAPRAAYVNYKDLDLGKNEDGNTSYTKASVWGKMYFKNNFERLALVKKKADPENFFRDEQSIPTTLS